MKFLVLLALLGATMPARAADLREMLETAVKSGQKRLVIPPGEYRVGPRGDDQNLISLNNASDMEIIADGVTMICTKRMRALQLNHCRNFVLRGLTIDYDPLTFTQGTVSAMADDKSWLDVKLDAGYPRYLADRIVICDPKTRFHKRGINHLWGTKAAWNGPDTIRISRPDVAQNVDLGDPVALSAGQETGNCHGITVEAGSSGVVFQDVTLHCAPGMGLIDTGSEVGIVLQNFRITPGPKPAGATAERLLTTSWDGIQCQAARVGAKVENSVIERCGDDSWSVTSRDWEVWAREGDKLLFAKPATQLRVGDTLQYQNGPTAKIVGVADVSREKDGVTVTLSEISLDTPLPAQQGSHVANLNFSSAGFVYKNNRIASHGRGALVKVGDGLIEGNTFRISDKAVIVNPEVGGLDGGASHLIIRNNTIIETGYHQAMPWSDQAGAIGISAVIKGGELRPAGTFNDILIENNTFEGVKGLNLLITSARNVVVRNNRFLQTHQTEALNHNGADYKFNPYAIAELRNCDGVTFEGNTCEKGPFTQKLVVVGQGVENVQGLPAE